MRKIAFIFVAMVLAAQSVNVASLYAAKSDFPGGSYSDDELTKRNRNNNNNNGKSEVNDNDDAKEDNYNSGKEEVDAPTKIVKNKSLSLTRKKSISRGQSRTLEDDIGSEFEDSKGSKQYFTNRVYYNKGPDSKKSYYEEHAGTLTDQQKQNYVLLAFKLVECGQAEDLSEATRIVNNLESCQVTAAINKLNIRFSDQVFSDDSKMRIDIACKLIKAKVVKNFTDAIKMVDRFDSSGLKGVFDALNAQFPVEIPTQHRCAIVQRACASAMTCLHTIVSTTQKTCSYVWQNKLGILITIFVAIYFGQYVGSLLGYEGLGRNVLQFFIRHITRIFSFGSKEVAQAVYNEANQAIGDFGLEVAKNATGNALNATGNALDKASKLFMYFAGCLVNGTCTT